MTYFASADYANLVLSSRFLNRETMIPTILSSLYQCALFAQGETERQKEKESRCNLYRIKRYVCSRGDDVQRSIELLDKVLSEYDEHDAEGEGGGGGSGSGGGGCVGGGGSGGVGDCGSSTEPSIGLTPDDESPSLGTLFLVYRFPTFLISSRDERNIDSPLARVCRARLTDVRTSSAPEGAPL